MMLPALLLSAFSVQDPAPVRDIPDHAPIQAVVEELYRAICYAPGEEPDWDGMAAVFHPQARLVLAWPEGAEPRVQEVQDFVAEFRTALATPEARASGFLEGPTRLEIMRFGGIAHVDAIFEAYMPPDAERPVRRGIDSFQLVQVGTEWKVLSLTSAIVLPDRPLGDRLPARQVIELSLRGEAVGRDDATDTQDPHDDDEVYDVLSGRGRMTAGGKEGRVEAGDPIDVDAKLAHRFHDIEEDLELLVFFALGPRQAHGG